MNNLGHSPAEEEEVDPILELIEEDMFQIDEGDPSPASDVIDLTKETTRKVIVPIGDPKETPGANSETYGMADLALRRPYNEVGDLSEGMFIKSGNEEGEVNVIGQNFNIAAFTHTGVDRKKNDDGLLVDSASNTLAVTDGVGGEKHGEVASNITLHTMAQKLIDKDVPLKDIPNLALKAVKEYQANNGEEYAKCSATFAAVHVTPEGIAQMVHVGDARIIRIRNGVGKQLTTDDNLTELVKAQKGMTDVEAKDFINDNYPNPRPDALVQSIGGREQVVNFKNEKGDIETSKDIVNPHYHEEQTQKGDIYVVATDGLTGNMDADDVAEYITKGLKAGKPLNIIMEEMKKETIARMIDGVGDKDNLTAGILEIK